MMISDTMTRIYRRAFRSMLAGGLLLIAHAASAQTWSSVASACIPGDSSIGLYKFDDGSVTFSATAPAITGIRLRCNVASPIDTTGSIPDWHYLRMGYKNPCPLYCTAKAELIRVDKSSGATFALATLTAAKSGPVIEEYVFLWALDFDSNDYFVQITLTRLSGSLTPEVWFVELT